ncbi:MAG TPA: hypothetical protein PLY24_02410 [Methanomassiliicoccales archaeon]|nr:hypothetical protein [Methanomassiliicoccales archaeon]
MERKAGFKECPKCGLRNKPSATQCDFCGQALISADDWQQHIKDLESLNRIELHGPVDERTSKRIESTIIRKETAPQKNVDIREADDIGRALQELDEQAPSPKNRGPERTDIPRPAGSASDGLMRNIPITLEVAAIPTEAEPPVKEGTPSAPEEAGTGPVIEEGVSQPSGEGMDAQQAAPADGGQASAAEPVAPEAEGQKGPGAAVEPGMLSSPEVDGAADAGTETAVSKENLGAPASVEQEAALEAAEADHRSMAEPSVQEEGAPTAPSPSFAVQPPSMAEVTEGEGWEGIVPIAVLALGIVGYLSVLTLIALGVLGTAIGLIGGAVSSLMIISGAVFIYPSIRRKDDGEVFICPRCHERVGRRADSCPACGAELASED